MAPELSTPVPGQGLSSQEAAHRLAKYGPNAIAEEKRHLMLDFLAKLWAPVPWMLEATIVLELLLGRFAESAVIGFLLLFNAVLSFVQEDHAQKALALLRRSLTVQVRIFRDGQWSLIPAQKVVPGDTIYLRMGDLVPADVRLSKGQILADQSALTGESLPVEAVENKTVYAGAVVKRGEAVGKVTATGSHTYFGQTAELVQSAKTQSHLEEIIFKIVKYLVGADFVLLTAVVFYGRFSGMPWHIVLPFALVLLVASVPVALPATFTFSTALGSSELAGRGVLTTRLSAIEEAAAMDVLASDKTGTLTENRLTLTAVQPCPPFSKKDVLQWGALASEEATKDPLDIAIIQAAREKGLPVKGERITFVPFEPATKRSECLVREPDGSTFRAIKGSPTTVASLTGGSSDLKESAEKLEANGYRVLAVAAGPQAGPLQPVGLLALRDAPRKDSASLIKRLNNLGVRVVMVTGDDSATATAVASEVGISGPSCVAQRLRGKITGETLRCVLFAGVFPRDKFKLVQAFQTAGHIVGMTGDGVNDAPALKQAEVGIAVAAATDVAKSAASLVLTTPGLKNIVNAVETSRQIYQRMLTYTLNKIIKTLQVALFLSLGLLLAHVLVVTPLLIILLIFANDFVTMSIATDNVYPSRKPDRWHIGALMTVALGMAVPLLILSFGFLYAALDILHLPLPQLQTLMFVMLVFTGQGTVYLIRERRHFWRSMPGKWLLASSAVDIAAVSLLATRGILMAAVSFRLLIATLAVILLYMLVIDVLKVAIFRAFKI